MLVASRPKDPVVLSYLALRKTVGWTALLLPFALIVPWMVAGHGLPLSISGYYWTWTRNLLVGSLCAISAFMLGCRGYDRKDEIAGTVAGVCALGVAFCPTSPESGATAFQLHVRVAHYIFATSLFATLAYFCLVLFKMTAATREMTPQKRSRNLVYTLCGWAILLSMLLLGIFALAGRDYLIRPLGATFCFETTSLIAFGVAWLIKGEAFLKDKHPHLTRTLTTDGHVMLQTRSPN